MSDDAKTTVLTEAEILERLAPIVADSLRVEAADVTAQSNLADLGAESLDLIQINLDVESAFDIYLPEKDILSTAQEVFGRGVLTNGGFVTDVGRELLMARMPELAPAQLPDPLPVAHVERLFLSVAVWVRLIHQLTQLRADQKEESGNDAPPEPADEWNRRWVEQYVSERYPNGTSEPVAAPE